jgi:hypothetical protein
LLPLEQGENLGVPIYEQRLNRKKRGTLQTDTWKDHPNGLLSESSSTMVLPPGQMTGLGATAPLYICSTTSSGCRLLFVTNETARALNLLAKQGTKMHNAIYKNRLALDYLLASEGGVCGKFNLSNCCLQIDDEEKS